jgi:pilus assembly protein CpaB
MLLRVALFIMLAVGIIGGGAVAWVLLAPPSAAPDAGPQAMAPEPKAIMLVTAHPIRGGSLLKPEDLTGHEVVRDEMPAGASLDTPQTRSSLAGAMIRHSLAEGQPILPADVVRPGEHGFLAAVLAPNMRAITVAVDAVSGTAGLIWPGDRVDLILTQSLNDPTLTAGRRVAAETVLTGARVIAIDQMIVQGQAPDGSVTPANRTATLEVTSAQAERVLVAGHLGNLSLSVLSADHSPEGEPTAPATTESTSQVAAAPEKAKPSAATSPPSGGRNASAAGVTWAGDVSPALGGDTPKASVMIHVFQGGTDDKEFHF